MFVNLVVLAFPEKIVSVKDKYSIPVHLNIGNVTDSYEINYNSSN